MYQNHALLSRKLSLVNVKWPIAVMNRVKYNCHYILDSCIVIYTVVSDFSWHSFSTKQVVLQTLRKKSCVRRLGWVRMIGFMKKVKRKRWNCFWNGIYNWWVAGVRERTWHRVTRNYLVVYCVWRGTGGLKNRNPFFLQNQI